jgi:hypothetical protein
MPHTILHIRSPHPTPPPGPATWQSVSVCVCVCSVIHGPGTVCFPPSVPSGLPRGQARVKHPMVPPLPAECTRFPCQLRAALRTSPWVRHQHLGMKLLSMYRSLMIYNRQSSNRTSPGSCRFEDLYYFRKGVWLYDSASVAAKIRHFEDLSDVRVSDLRTVNCIWEPFSGILE